MLDGFSSKQLQPNVITAADFWAGAGGTSTGLREAVKELGFDLELTAVKQIGNAVPVETAKALCKAMLANGNSK